MSGNNVNKKNLGCSTNVIHHYAHVNTAPYNMNSYEDGHKRVTD